MMRFSRLWMGVCFMFLELINVEEWKMECKEHDFRIFKDTKLVGSGYLSFYCRKCLKVVKVKKSYSKI